MKQLFILMTMVLGLGAAHAQNDCNPYLPPAKGAKWEITTYSDKDKETGRIAYELVDREETAEGVTFTVKAAYFDKKGKEGYQSTYKAYCRDGKFELDMAFMVNGEAMQAYQNMEAEIDATNLTMPPLDSAPGTSLPDGSMTMKMGSGGVTMFTTTVAVTDRKVESRENITTPAGTFDCLKTSQTVNTKAILNVTASSIDWYAEKVGMVRSESYNKNGKLAGYSVLTKLEKM